MVLLEFPGCPRQGAIEPHPGDQKPLHLVNLKYAKKMSFQKKKNSFLLKMYFLYNNYLFGFWLPFVTFCKLTAVCLRNHGTILSEISSLELWANE